MLTVSMVIAFFIYASHESSQSNSLQPNQYDYFVTETIDADSLEYSDPWTIWKNSDFDNMENGELILLKNLDGDYDISAMEYAVVQKINGVVLISQVTKTSFDEILEQKNIEYNDKDQFTVLDTQIEIGATIDIFHTTFSEIEVPIKQINISAKETREKWIFAVKDNGIGIEAKYFEQIFIIFRRINNKADYQGNGIGLAHCKKIVEIHNGEIWVNSTPNVGSTFYFTIDKNI